MIMISAHVPKNSVDNFSTESLSSPVCHPVCDASGYWNRPRLMAGDGDLFKAHFLSAVALS